MPRRGGGYRKTGKCDQCGYLNHTNVAAVTFDSFGNSIATTNAAFTDRYAFAGREIDTSGFYYNRARSYNAGTGVFVQQDPLSFNGRDTNLYRYSFSAPTNFSDAFGLLAASEFSSQSSKKDAKVAQGAKCTGNAVSSKLVEIALFLVGLNIGEAPPEKIVNADGAKPLQSSSAPFDPKKPPKQQRPSRGKRPRGLRKPRGNCSPFDLG